MVVHAWRRICALQKKLGDLMASHKSIWKTRVSHPTNWAAWGTFRLGELQESALSPPKDNNADVRTFTHVCASLQVCLILFLWQEDTANPRQVGPPTRKRAATEPNKRETEMMTSRFVSSDKDINTYKHSPFSNHCVAAGPLIWTIYLQSFRWLSLKTGWRVLTLD